MLEQGQVPDRCMRVQAAFCMKADMAGTCRMGSKPMDRRGAQAARLQLKAVSIS